MSDLPPLYAASVPVFRHYLARIAALGEKAGPAALDQRIADAFPARQQFATATGFALRVAFPLAGHAVPDLPADLPDRLATADQLLADLDPADFVGADRRVIRHRAGFADLEQDGATFLHLYGMPNFLFHLTMGYAALRSAGVALGKADFDGLHHYPEGFRF